jgi:hypothetical protein
MSPYNHSYAHSLLFLVLQRPESQSLTRATPRVHEGHLTLIPPSPIAPTHTSPLALHSSKSPPSPSICRCCCLFTAITTCLCRLPPPPPPLLPLLLPLLPPPPFPAAYRCWSFSITGSGIDRNSSEVLGGHSYSPRSSLSIPWIDFSC